MESDRSYARITRADLRRLERLAQKEREEFFDRHPEWSLLYRRRRLGAAIAGSSALHYLNGITGLTEFEVWTFYAEHAEAPFPFQRVTHADFGVSKFGRAQDAPERYAGRRVVLHARSIHAGPGADPLEAIQRYLRSASTPSARQLAAQAVVMLDPEELLGLEAWPSLVLPPRR
jgi:hypothetical protein